MFAFKREEHSAQRNVLIEKDKNFTDIERYCIEKYDTVEVIRGNKKLYGLLYASGLRGGKGTKEYRKKRDYKHATITVGYSSVCLIQGTTLQKVFSSSFLSISDDTKNGIFVSVKPARCILFEKNLVQVCEESWDEYRRNVPIMGG